MMREKYVPTEEKKTDLLSRFIGIGLALGVAFGAAIDNIGLGIALGIAIGAGLGTKAKNKQDEKDQ